jgi:hypothetical protein
MDLPNPGSINHPTYLKDPFSRGIDALNIGNPHLKDPDIE